MSTKRVTVTVDETLLEVAARAVEQGDADSVSAWVSQAMAHRHATEQRLAGLSAAIADYEAVHGVITADEIDEQRRLDRDQAAAQRRRPLPPT